MVLRLPAGSGTGAAAQHSESLESWFLSVPGLKIVAPATPYDAKGMLLAAIADNNPVLFVENKLLYKIPRAGSRRSIRRALGQCCGVSQGFEPDDCCYLDHGDTCPGSG